MSAKKEKTTASTQQTATTTPNVPTWIQNAQQGYLGAATDIFGQGPAAFTPGPANPLQVQAQTGAANLGTSSLFGQAGQIASGVAGAGANTGSASLIGGAPIDVQAGQSQAGSLLDNLQAYMNPATGAVVDTTLAGFDQQAARTKAAMDAQAGRDRAFGGSGYAIREGVNAADSNLNRAATEAQLRQSAFNTGVGLSAQDAAQRTSTSIANAGNQTQANVTSAGLNANRDLANQAAQNSFSQFNAQQQDNALTRQLQAAGLLGDLGASQGNDARANIATQAGVGAQQYAQDTAAQQYPLDWLSQYMASVGYDPSLFIGQTANSNGSSKGSSTSIGGGISFSPKTGFSFGAA